MLALSQVFVKLGLNIIGGFTIHLKSLISNMIPLLKSYYIGLGVLSTLIGAIIWLRILCNVNSSIAYPLISISNIFGLIAAMFLLGENVTFMRFIGVCVIILGVFLITR